MAAESMINGTSTNINILLTFHWLYPLNSAVGNTYPWPRHLRFDHRSQDMQPFI